MKALRGTKRECRACAARFYDLSRELIICPLCGARYVPDVAPMAAEDGARAQRFTGKTGWRSRSSKQPEAGSEAEAESSAESNVEPFAPTSNEHAVLDEEADEADISDLVGHHEPEPKEP